MTNFDKVKKLFCEEFTLTKLATEDLENTSDRNVTRAVKRRIHDLYGIGNGFNDLRMDDLLLELCHILIVYLFTDHVIQMLCDSLFLGHCQNIIVIRDRKHFAYDIRISR